METVKIQSRNELFYCTDCNSESDSVNSINHSDDCSVITPDDVPLPFDEQTNREIKQVVNDAMLADMKQRDNEVFEDCNPDPKQAVKDNTGVNWVSQGTSSRFCVGLGQTNGRGRFRDNGGLVLKVSPAVRQSKLTPDDNLNELDVWDSAVRRCDDDLFANILACARDGAWLVMEECVPVYPRFTMEAPDYRDHIVREDGVDNLVEEVKRCGWSHIDYKHGNVGLTDNRNLVFIDYGTGMNRC